ncbi:MAG: bifunctional DNA-formamidopyrimidine glycosylase/DNA-(apurinic or apyrimidinic site) lyase [Candidatus Aminicenantes bacterium]|nr:bifunctional DNA-formamidopyrimidine glycosylase/DNA-(apurinic or apyrimidinic site) lyase [Candidatus Aminicenantes bacterium]
MPELPEVETIIRSLSSKLIGLEGSSFNFFFPGLLKNNDQDILQKLKGKKVIHLRRRGKWILIDFENNLSLVCHLKMTGQLLFIPSERPLDKHTHFILSFKDSRYELRFRDVRKFGSISCYPTPEVLKFLNLGPEPLRVSFSHFRKLFQGRRGRLKNLLLNQSFLAGIGNIYADEILFEAKLHPGLPVSLLEEEEFLRLWKAIRFILRMAIEYRGTSIRDFRDAEGQEGDFRNRLRVYGKESELCSRCGEEIERLRKGGRSSFFCPQCQVEKNRGID